MNYSQTQLNGPPYDIKGLANLFLDWASQEAIAVSPMKLQKLLYFCHADYLQLTGGPLAHQSFEAWDFGPVDPSIFEEFKRFSKLPITERAYRFDPIAAKRVLATITPDGDSLNVLRNLFDFYKRASATALSDMSHMPSGPWDVARRLYDKGRIANRRMSDKLIFSYHHCRLPAN